MANFQTAFNFLMDNEDAPRAYKTVPDACPNGCAGPCYAIAGINSAAFPLQFAKINALPEGAARGLEIETFYQTVFWNQWYNQLNSDEVAKRVFDFSVNAGSVVAVKCLQRAIYTTGCNISVDGAWGPATVAAANGCDEKRLVGDFQQQRIVYYKVIVAAHPEDQKYLLGWVARASK